MTTRDVSGGRAAAHTRQLAADIARACRLEASAPKPGNVHPHTAFADTTFDDFVRAGAAIAPALATAAEYGVGTAVLQAVQAMQAAVGRNTSLGIILLIAPLAAAPAGVPLTEALPDVLQRLTVDDARAVYCALRLAASGGLGTATQQDVRDEPTATLREVMQLAAERDGVARQYATDFHDVLHSGPALFRQWRSRCADPLQAIVGLHLSLMALRPDTLIARKLGVAIAVESASRAAEVLNAGWPDAPAGIQQCAELDAWLRADGNRRNPGTTADLVAAIVFAVLRDHPGLIPDDA